MQEQKNVTKTLENAASPANPPKLQPKDDLVNYVTAYAKENPGVVALWCFGIGFVVGWKLKPW